MILRAVLARWGGGSAGLPAGGGRAEPPCGGAKSPRAAAASVVRAELDALVVVGGNGSLAGADVASRFRTARGEPLRVIGVPASIDNDIGYTSPAIGVDTALNTIVDACDKISDTAS